MKDLIDLSTTIFIRMTAIQAKGDVHLTTKPKVNVPVSIIRLISNLF